MASLSTGFPLHHLFIGNWVTFSRVNFAPVRPTWSEMIRPTHTHAGKRRPKEKFSLSPKVGSPTCYITVATTTQKKAVENFRRESLWMGRSSLGLAGHINRDLPGFAPDASSTRTCTDVFLISFDQWNWISGSFWLNNCWPSHFSSPI